MQIARSALVLRPIEHVYTIIEHAEAYPEFLPLCTRVEILERREDFVNAHLSFGYAGLAAKVYTEVTKTPHTGLDVRIGTWPFERFRGIWTLAPMSEEACRVEFAVDWHFGDPIWDRVLGVAAGWIADRMVEAFLVRARERQER
jgi:ribosome-associated toxin RatA of RatAB toxin-antitoxin module